MHLAACEEITPILVFFLPLHALTFSLSHLPDFVWGVVLLRDDASEAALPAFGEELLFLKASEQRHLPRGFRAIRLLERLPSELEGSMRKSKFTDEQVVAILRRGDRDPMAVVATAAQGERTYDLLLSPASGTCTASSARYAP